MKSTVYALLFACSLYASAQEVSFREEGPVQLVGSNGVLVISGKPFVITPQTEVTILGKRSSFLEIKPGATASVIYQKQAGFSRATRVDVSTQRQESGSGVGPWQQDSQWLAIEKQIKANRAKLEELRKESETVERTRSAKISAGQNASREQAQLNAVSQQRVVLARQIQTWEAEQAKIRARYQALESQKRR